MPNTFQSLLMVDKGDALMSINSIKHCKALPLRLRESVVKFVLLQNSLLFDRRPKHLLPG